MTVFLRGAQFCRFVRFIANLSPPVAGIVKEFIIRGVNSSRGGAS